MSSSGRASAGDVSPDAAELSLQRMQAATRTPAAATSDKPWTGFYIGANAGMAK